MALRTWLLEWGAVNRWVEARETVPELSSAMPISMS